MRRKRKWNSRNRFSGGLTFIEMIIAIGMGSAVSIGVMSLFIITAREQRIGYIEQRLFDHADRIQERITNLFRESSRASGIFLGSPDGACFRKILFRSGVGSENMKLEFDPNSGKLAFDPDIKVEGNEIDLGVPHNASHMVFLDNVRFRSTMKTGGVPDSSVILVIIDVSDHGFARQTYRDPGNKANWITLSRTFAVNLRRE